MNETKIKVRASKEYNVIIGKGLLDVSANYLDNLCVSKKTVIVSDDKVFYIYGETLMRSLSQKGIKSISFVFKRGETSKDIKVLTQLLEFLAINNISRDSLIIALGGGVTGDLAGFAASVYLRGIPYVQIPTTLLAAVDSSVGGKTAINLSAGKNLAGSFYQPSLVLCDIDTFKTLDYDDFADGISEAIKYGIICDKALFEKIKQEGFSEDLLTIVSTCVSIKRDIVERDEFDTGLRQLLNLGHTFGHAIEKCSNFSIRHGHAVSIGLAAAAKVSETMGIAKKPIYEKIRKLIESYKLPYANHFEPEDLFNAALSDKKINSDKITLVMIEDIGQSILYPVNIDSLLNIFKIAVKEDL